MIRPFRPSDIDEVTDVWYRSSRIADSFLSDDLFDAERREVRDRWIPIAETTVYEDDGHVVGFISLIGNEVGAFFVDPAHQGRGIGRHLMDRARSLRPWLELDVFESNPSGRRFSDAYGFVFESDHIHEATGQKELRLRLA